MKDKVSKLQKENNKIEEKINKENQAVFTDMICYIRSANISDYNQELVRRDLSEMVLSAQERREDIHCVIGRDFKEFCDEVIINLPPKTTKEKIFDGLDICCSSLAILGTINILLSNDFRRIIKEVLSKDSINYNVGISFGMIISTVAIMVGAIFIIKMVSKNAFKKPSDANRVNRMFIGGATGAGVMIAFIIISKFGSSVIFSINIFIVALVLVVLFILHKFFSRI